MALRKIDEFTQGAHTVKVHKDSETGDYRCRLYSDGKAQEAADYFTGDKNDALGTAQAMLGQAAEPAEAHEVQPPIEQARPSPKRPRGFYARPSRLFGALLSAALA